MQMMIVTLIALKVTRVVMIMYTLMQIANAKALEHIERYRECSVDLVDMIDAVRV